MKAIFCLLLLVALAKSHENDAIVEVIDQMIRTKTDQEISTVNFITSSTASSHDNELLSDIIAKVSKSKLIMTLKEENLSKLKGIRLVFNVIIVNSMESFKNLLKSFNNKKFKYGGYYVIIFENASRQDAYDVFSDLWDFYIHNVNLIRRENDTVVVETFMPFQPSECNQTKPVEIARYENGKFIHRPATFFPKKFENFHKCPIKITTFASLAPAVLKTDFPNGSYELYGRDVKVVRTLENEFNFHANITYLEQYGSWGILYSNGTTSGAMGQATRREAELTLGNLNLKLDRTLIMDYSFGYYLETLIFAIPRGEPYSSFHKLLRPFDNSVWISILITISITFLVIIFISFQSRLVRHFVFGMGIRYPSLNVMMGIFGISQHKLPSRNFARFLLMTFLMFCLVIRSLYQGSLYQFLQLSDNQPEAASIEDMAERDYTFYMIASYDDMTRDNVAMKNRRKIITPAELYVIMNGTLQPHFRGSNIIAISEVLYKNMLRARNREDLYTICKVRKFIKLLYKHLIFLMSSAKLHDDSREHLLPKGQLPRCAIR
jgi:hypothetical protein